MSRFSLLWAREIGECSTSSFQRAEKSQRVYSLQLSDECNFEPVHTGGINSLDLDSTEQRYLLTGGTDKLITIYDTWNLTQSIAHTVRKVAVIGRPQHSRFAHKFSVVCVQWYEHDNGIFTSSSSDMTLKIWDANALRPVETFNYKHIINSHAMSKIATSHNLIAVATKDSAIYLADMRTGTSIHMLRGHRGSVSVVKWSRKNPYGAVSGGEDNQIFEWDVRQARGHIRSYDQHNGRDGKTRKSGSTAHNGHVNGLSYTKDGLFLLSCGTDSRLRLWNTDTGENTLTNYGRIDNRYRRNIEMATDSTSNTAFVPIDRSILMVNILEGSIERKLTAHFNSPTCCEFNDSTQELYTGGQDNNILVWGNPSPPPGDVALSRDQGQVNDVTRENVTTNLTADAWSDESDEG